VLIVAQSEPTAFRRWFPFEDYRRGDLLRASVWFTVETIAIVVITLVLGIVLGLLVHRGEVTIAATDAAAVVQLAGPHPGLLVPESPEAAEAAQPTHLIDVGILPDVVRQKDRFPGRVLGLLYNRVSELQHNSSALVLLVAVAGIAAVVRRLAFGRARSLIHRYSDSVGTRVRQALHHQVQRLGPSDLEGTQTKPVLQLFTRDVQSLAEGVLAEATAILRDPFRLMLLLVMVLAIDAFLALQCLVPLLLCWFLQRRADHSAVEVLDYATSLADRELRLLSESLHKSRLIRGYGMEKFQQDQFRKYLDRFQRTTSDAIMRGRWLRRSAAIATVVCTALIAILVGEKVLRGQRGLTLSEAAVIGAGFALMLQPLQSLADLARQLSAPRDSATRIQTYLNRIPEVGQALGAKFLNPLSKQLEFQNVTYSLPGRPALLDGLSLVLPAGKTYALAATDQLEARALLALLPRFIEPQSGKVLIDGEDIAWVTLESLRAEVMLAGGDDPFLSGTIRENIACGDDRYSIQDVTEAAKISHAHNFIAKLPQGYETVIGEHGEQLDVGQLYRLSLARAILRKPALMILEEPSGLEESVKALLDDCIQRIAQGRTLLILPGRLPTLRRADAVVFLHRGKVNAVGRHNDLVESSELYRHWEYLKFNAFRREISPEEIG
jgi:ABC-type multidrug transport system fused ATPase/permease subunit